MKIEMKTYRCLVFIYTVYSPYDISAWNEDRRKRMKTESPALDDTNKSSGGNVTSDDLNAAFSVIDDEVIAPTQFEVNPIRTHKSPRTLKVINKENDSTKSPIRSQKKYAAVATVEKSPTVLRATTTNRNPQTKVQVVNSNEVSLVRQTRSMSTWNESPKWQSKASIANGTSRRLFENTITDKNSPSLSQWKRTNAHQTRNKPSLSLQTNRILKQSTISFKKVSNRKY